MIRFRLKEMIADYQFNEYNFDNVDVNSFQAGVRASF